MKKIKLQIFAVIIYVITICLTLYWYDWKLLLIIFLFVFANNIERHVAEIIKDENITKKFF